MTPFERASIPDEEIENNVALIMRQWIAGEEDCRKSFNASSAELAEQMIRAWLVEIREHEEVYLNDTYQVNLRRQPQTQMIHLSIKRIDKQPIHDWRQLQKIKNALVGPEYEAVELYPKESRLVDAANQFHLWVVNIEGYQFPFGFNSGRNVSDVSIGKSVNRPLA